MNRRNFVKSLIFLGSTGLTCTLLSRLITGCSTHNGPRPTTAGRNQYFKGPGHQRQTFLMNIREGYSPGVDWTIPEGTPVVACAKGKVIRVRHIPVRAGGELLQIQHASNVLAPLSMVLDSIYRTDYAHLNKVSVTVGQEVNRGQIIGFAGDSYTSNVFKLMLLETDFRVNPDNYGMNHSFMNYWDEKTDLDFQPDVIKERYITQRWVVKNLLNSYKSLEKDEIPYYYHTDRVYGPTLWSEFEKFKYLEDKFKSDPNMFEITSEKFVFYKNEFYQNQPIILTLPFKKP